MNYSIVMVKCGACSDRRCKGQYENRSKCQNRNNCTCACQESADDTFWKGLGSVAFGVAAFAGGVVLAASTGGWSVVGMAAVAPDSLIGRIPRVATRPVSARGPRWRHRRHLWHWLSALRSSTW